MAQYSVHHPCITRTRRTGRQPAETRAQSLYSCTALVQSPHAELSDDKRYVLLPDGSSDFLKGFTRGRRRESLTSDGRFAKKVRTSLLREYEKYGRLKVGILPPPGASSGGPASEDRTRATRGAGGKDIGLEVVDAVAEMMTIDEEWSTRDERGFTWWGKDHAQRVWSEPPLDDDGIEIFRLHARTRVLRDFDPSDENLAKLNALSMVATTSGFVVDPDDRYR